MKTAPAQRRALERYFAKQRAWYRAQPLEHRLRFTRGGKPRKKGALDMLIRDTTKYRNLGEVRTAVQNHEITHGSLPPPLQQRIHPGTGNGQKHKDQYGESLEQMGKRLGISKEAVRMRIIRWGSPEHSAKPKRVLGQKTYASPTSFISARKLRCWGYDSLAQLAQQSDNEILKLYHMSPRLLKMLRALYPSSTS